MQNLQKLLIGHGILILAIAMLAGFMLAFGLIGGLELFPGFIVEMPYYGTSDGWARAHTGGALNGIMLIVIALALPLIPLSAAMVKKTTYGLIFVGWANTVFYWFGNASSNRALSLGDNPLGGTNFFGSIGYGVAIIGAFVLIWLLLYAAWRLFATRDLD